MDQAQNPDLKIAQALISRLIKEVTDLRGKNVQPQVWPDPILPIFCPRAT